MARWLRSMIVIAVGLCSTASVVGARRSDAVEVGVIRIPSAAEGQRATASDPCAGVPASHSGTLRAVRMASGLSIPLHVTAPPQDTSRIFIVEQGGRIRILKDGNLLPAPFLDLSGAVSCCGERGLLGLAFHADFARNGWFFVDYTDTGGNTVIARYAVSDDPDVADPTSGQVLLRVVQPFGNHNGGHLAFGPDGHLYAGLGDGGSAGDPQENGQSDSTLLGKLLRIDVDLDGPPYHAVPADNPNAAVGSPLGLIWAKGLRNPWRFSFDRDAGDLYIADVGQNQWEEVNVQHAGSAGGANYGWDVFEGNHCFDPSPHLAECPEAPGEFTMPAHEYSHADGCSITGGYVYRGCRMPWLRGTYFYGDFCSAFVRSFTYGSGIVTNHRDWTEDLALDGRATIGQITCFGEDTLGELYICDREGEVFQLVPGPPGAESCRGDCDGNGVVEVSELVQGVKLALAGASTDGCRALDRNADGRVTIDELVLAVGAALAGCPASPPAA